MLPVDEATRAKVAELTYLETSIGRTGLLAIQPMCHMSHKDLWQLYMLQKWRSLDAPAELSTSAHRRAGRMWLGRKDSNPRMPESKSGALTNLATPQQRKLCARTYALIVRGIRLGHQANAANGCRASVLATKPCMVAGRASTAALRFGFGGKGRKHTAARTRHPRKPRALAQTLRVPPPRPEIAQPLSAADRSGHNPRKRRSIFADAVSRVNSGAAKIDAVPTENGGHDYRYPQRRQRYRNQALADAARERGSGAEKKGNVGAQRETDPHEVRARQTCAPELVEREQHRRGVGTAPAQPPAQWNALGHSNVDALRPTGRRLRAVAARTTRSSCGATPFNSVVRAIAPSSRQVSVIMSPTSSATSSVSSKW